MESEYDAAFHRDKFELTTTPRGYPQRVAGRLYRTAPTMAPIGAFFFTSRGSLEAMSSVCICRRAAAFESGAACDSALLFPLLFAILQINS